MNNRVKNAKLFSIALAGTLLIGGLVTYNIVSRNTDINKGILAEYSSSKNTFEYGNKLDLKDISSDDIVVGQELHILDSNMEFYKHIRTSSMLKQISEKSLSSESKEEPIFSINHLVNSTGENLSATSTYYKTMLEFQNEYIKENNYDASSTRAVTCPFIVAEEGSVLYINDFVYFINKNSNEILDIVNVNSKFNHKEDKLIFMKAEKQSKSTINNVRKIVSSGSEAYDAMQSKLPQIIESLGDIKDTDIHSVKIFSKNSVLVTIPEDGKDKYIEVNIDDFSTKELAQ